jgi:hypothetical protein
VNESAGERTGAGREVTRLDEGGAEAAHRGVPGNARSGNAAADDEDVVAWPSACPSRTGRRYECP